LLLEVYKINVEKQNCEENKLIKFYKYSFKLHFIMSFGEQLHLPLLPNHKTEMNKKEGEWKKKTQRLKITLFDLQEREMKPDFPINSCKLSQF
jgi:hypothetical protein